MANAFLKSQTVLPVFLQTVIPKVPTAGKIAVYVLGIAATAGLAALGQWGWATVPIGLVTTFGFFGFRGKIPLFWLLYLTTAGMGVCVYIATLGTIGTLGFLPLALGPGLAFLVNLLKLRFIPRLTHTQYIGPQVVITSLGFAGFVWGLIALPWQGQALGAKIGTVLPAVTGLFQMLFSIGDAVQYRKVTTKRKGFGVGVGDEAPLFELANHRNEMVRLVSYRDQTPLLLLFVRGDWCPYCHMTLRTYAKNVDKFLEKGIRLIAIGPDPAGVNREMVENLGLPFELLSDETLGTTAQYGVEAPLLQVPDRLEGKGIPLPASFLVDLKGIIRYTSRPDRVGEFLDPNTVFVALQEIHEEYKVQK
jgi:peroxiredoxin